MAAPVTGVVAPDPRRRHDCGFGRADSGWPAQFTAAFAGIQALGSWMLTSDVHEGIPGQPSFAWPHRIGAALRGLTFVAIAVFLLVSPSLRQVFGVRYAHVRAWDMFKTTCDNYVIAKFYTRNEAGELIKIDRFALLGYKSRAEAPEWVARIRKTKEMNRVVGRLCKKLPKGAQGLFVDAQIAKLDGWRPLHHRGENLCPSPSRP